MDLIDRQQAIDALCSECQGRCIQCDSYPCSEVEVINALPSAEPDIIYCKDCKRHNISVEDTWDQYKKWCPLVAYRGKAQGHEFDYQFCVCGERRTG